MYKLYTPYILNYKLNSSLCYLCHFWSAELMENKKTTDTVVFVGGKNLVHYHSDVLFA
jgi:hypothetical protein